MKRLALLILVAAACKSKREAPPAEDATEARVPPAPVAAQAPAWRELAALPHARPARTIALPVGDGPRFEVAGPVIAGDLAIVASSQLGFCAVDWRTGRTAWTKRTGEHVAPPLAHRRGVVLIAQCAKPVELRPGERLLGCVRVVGVDGEDASHVAIRGAEGATDDFAGARGAQAVWVDAQDQRRLRTNGRSVDVDDGEHVRWRRGDQTIVINVDTGAAVPADGGPPSDGWTVAQEDGALVARSVRRPAAVRTLPGIGVLGVADATGAGAVAVRLDSSLEHDYVAALTPDATVAWVWPLPAIARPDPVGVAVAPDAVVVFHDGDTVTVLPAPAVRRIPTP
ncbi:MAG: hypothetical protein KIT31_26640 [Deltaproteobacteria bacterium]|nr:hypothetical protein [Deltaproteobacteria bacterium]